MLTFKAVLLRRKQNQHLGRTESVIRMSRNAQRNLKHEELDDEYTSRSTGSNGMQIVRLYSLQFLLTLSSSLPFIYFCIDVMLSNTNMELDFADEHDLRQVVESPTVSNEITMQEKKKREEKSVSHITRKDTTWKILRRLANLTLL